MSTNVQYEYDVKKLSDEKLQAALRFEPHEGQKEVLACDERVRVVCCGVRWGKSYLAAYLALRNLLQDNKHIWIVAPDYSLTEKVFSHLEQMIATGVPELADNIARRPTPKIRTPWNSWVEVKSGENPQSMLGEELDLVIIDEASRLKRNVWESYIYQRLNSRMGDAVMISTPKGKNWFFEEFQRAKKKGAAFQYETKDNPHFPMSEWTRAEERMPKSVFNQEYRAVFLENAASVFRDIHDCVEDDIYEDYNPSHYYTMGVDLAKHEDFSCIVVLDNSNNKVVYFDRFKDVSWTMQKKRIMSVAKRYHARVTLDSTGIGDPISEDLKKEGVLVEDFKFYTSSKSSSKQQLVEKLSVFIEQGYITIPNEEVLLDELESYAMEVTDSGRVKYSAPQGMHDDTVIALGLAVFPVSYVQHSEEDPDVVEEQFDPHDIFSI